MCDAETRKRLETIEIKIGIVSTDVVWLKRIVSFMMVLLLASFGLNMHGVVI